MPPGSRAPAQVIYIGLRHSVRLCVVLQLVSSIRQHNVRQCAPFAILEHHAKGERAAKEGSLQSVSVTLLVTSHPFWMLVPRCRGVGCMALHDEENLVPPRKLGDVCSLLLGSLVANFSLEGFSLVNSQHFVQSDYGYYYFVGLFHLLCPAPPFSSSFEQATEFL